MPAAIITAVTKDADLRLSAYYLNTRRLVELTGTDIPVVAQFSLNQNSGARAAAMRMASGIANDLLKNPSIQNLHKMSPDGLTEGVPQVAHLWDVLTFKGVPDALMREQHGKVVKPATVSGAITLGETQFKLTGELSNDHMFSDTSARILSGRRRMLVLGRFEAPGDQLEVEPFVIGDMMQDLGGALRMSWTQRLRLYPQQIDAFAKAADQRATAEELKTLLSIPEDNVKHAMAAIIGEPFVPKDWGGEKSDLQTSRVSIDGVPTSAAFIFKGPSVPGELHPARMGKRGDQLVRAYDEPVELVV
ncbi:MAG: hypothetical protein PGN08_13820, partial [Sphingomonas taxi]